MERLKRELKCQSLKVFGLRLMLGANQDSVGWPKCGEIDIMEAINDENLVYGTLHWFNDPGNNNADSGSSVAVADRTEYHVYGVEWTADKLRWYVDGKVYRTMDVSNDSFSEVRKEYFVIFNMAIGGQWRDITLMKQLSRQQWKLIGLEHIRKLKEQQLSIRDL